MVVFSCEGLGVGLHRLVVWLVWDSTYRRSVIPARQAERLSSAQVTTFKAPLNHTGTGG